MVNVAKLNFSANVCHLQQSVETPNLLHKQAAQAHELGLPCVICELLFVKFTLCIYPFHVCKFDVLDCGSNIYHMAIKKHNLHAKKKKKIQHGSSNNSKLYKIYIFYVF